MARKTIPHDSTDDTLSCCFPRTFTSHDKVTKTFSCLYMKQLPRLNMHAVLSPTTHTHIVLHTLGSHSLPQEQTVFCVFALHFCDLCRATAMEVCYIKTHFMCCNEGSVIKADRQCHVTVQNLKQVLPIKITHVIEVAPKCFCGRNWVLVSNSCSTVVTWCEQLLRLF